MGWFLVAAVVVAFAAYVWMLRGEGDAAQRRTRDHLERGGKPSDAPDWMPGHGGGSSGG